MLRIRKSIWQIKTNTKNAGFTKEEREKFDQIVENGLVDAFRYR